MSQDLRVCRYALSPWSEALQTTPQGAEELFGLRQGQPEMLDAFVVFVACDHLGDRLFLTFIAAHDELKFDTHTGASPGSSGREMIQAIVPELIYNPLYHLSRAGDHEKDTLASC